LEAGIGVGVQQLVFEELPPVFPFLPFPSLYFNRYQLDMKATRKWFCWVGKYLEYTVIPI
jgi:hypothetical protein